MDEEWTKKGRRKGKESRESYFSVLLDFLFGDVWQGEPIEMLDPLAPFSEPPGIQGEGAVELLVFDVGIVLKKSAVSPIPPSI